MLGSNLRSSNYSDLNCYSRFTAELLSLPIKVINCLVEKKMLKLALKLEMKQQLFKLKPTSKIFIWSFPSWFRTQVFDRPDLTQCY